MSAKAFPVDRWFSFEDRWPSSVVGTVLDQFHTVTDDLVYDPFVGCGTTAVAAAARGNSTFSCDINPIAALITQHKLNPPPLFCLLATVARIERLGIRQAVSTLTREPQSLGDKTGLSKFLLAVATLRSGWHLGNPWDELHILSELSCLVAEIREDMQSGPHRTSSHEVQCVDFRQASFAFASSESKRVVLITSPPFFGSDHNPRIMRLAELLDLDWPRSDEDHVVAPIQESVSVFLNSYNLTAVGYSAAAKHLIFLARIADHVANLKCANVAIEMSGALVEDKWVAFDEYLASCLKEQGYRVNLQVPSQGRQESERLICGTIP